MADQQELLLERPRAPEHLRERPDRQFLTQHEVAERLGMSEWKLKQLRAEGGGPRFFKQGRRVLYHTASVIDWAEQRLQESTSQSV